MLDRVVPRGGPKRVLDVGCGAGNMFHHLGRYGTVTGVDNNPRPLAVARERGYDVREAGGEALPLDDDIFDLVAVLDTVEHCEDDLAVLREAYRVTAPGGTLVVTVVTGVDYVAQARRITRAERASVEPTPPTGTIG